MTIKSSGFWTYEIQWEGDCWDRDFKWKTQVRAR